VPTSAELEQDYAEAWHDWLVSGLQADWETVVDDGLSEPGEEPQPHLAL